MSPPSPSAPDDVAADAAPGAASPRPRDAGVVPDAWSAWRAATPARIALGRAGAATPTAETLRFGLAHALARDAIHTPLDVDALEAVLRGGGWTDIVRARSVAPDRATYLRRPDLGRQLDGRDVQVLAGGRTDPPAVLSLVIGDGLSSKAVQWHAAPLLSALRPLLPPRIRLAPIVLVTQARVAVADDVGECLGATMTVMLIGERPGLSSPDSLGIYLTYGPRRGRRDAERNCISNVRPQGLAYDLAAFKLSWLIHEGLRRQLSGILLKDESDAAIPAPASTAMLGSDGA